MNGKQIEQLLRNIKGVFAIDNLPDNPWPCL